MLKLTRVCVPICTECNFHCTYCFRALGKCGIPPLNDTMRAYLKSLNPAWCAGFVVTGGEPLLHEERLYEIVSYVPKAIKKKVITNGWEIHDGFVEWANNNDVEVQISYDGNATKALRGVDIFDYEDVLSAVRKIKHLRINGVITAKNPDPYKNYLETKQKLDCEFMYHPQTLFAEDMFSYLVEDFDYAAYSRGLIRFLTTHRHHMRSEGYTERSSGLNVLPDGSVVSTAKLNVPLGTVLEDLETILARKDALGLDERCKATNCYIRDYCRCPGQLASPHFCKCMKIQFDALAYLDALNNEEIYEKTPDDPRCW